MAGPTIEFWNNDGEPCGDLLLCPDMEGKDGLDGSKEISPSEAVALAVAYFNSPAAASHYMGEDMKELKAVCLFFSENGLNENNRRK